MTDFDKILNKAKELETKMKESQEKIKSIQEWETEWKNLVIDTFNNINDNSWNDENIKQAIASVIKSYNNEMAGEGKRKLKQVDILKPLRFYCTGEYMGPPITEILELLGKDVVLNRLNV